MDSTRAQELNGIRLTTPFWTIIDLLDTRRIDYDYILEALNAALAKMIIRTKQMKEANLDDAQRERLLAALERIGYERIDEIRK